MAKPHRLYIYFVPFKQGESGADVVRKAAFDEVCRINKAGISANAILVQFAEKPNIFFQRADAHTVIYIVGHGNAGQQYISPLVDGGYTLGPFDIRVRLSRLGLPSDFAGEIKCFNCYSGADGEENESFAKVLSAFLANSSLPEDEAGRSYRSCIVWGYALSVSAAPATDSTLRHRTLAVPKEQVLGHHTATLYRERRFKEPEQLVLGRAKDFRVAFRAGIPITLDDRPTLEMHRYSNSGRHPSGVRVLETNDLK